MANNPWIIPANNPSADFIYPGSVPLTEFASMTLNGDYSAAGVGLANETGSGTINLTGTIPAGSITLRAFLYWITATNISTGTINGVNITGQNIGIVDVGINIFFFRADVTPYASQGVNILANFPARANTAGAALIIVYMNAGLPLKTVVINDGATVFANDTVSTILHDFVAGGLPLEAKTTYNGLGLPPNNAFFNGNPVDGTPAFDYKNGTAWDTLNVDVSPLVNQGDTTATATLVGAGGTLIYYIAQFFSVTATSLFRGVSF